MNHYRVRLNGQNFLLNYKDKQGKFGFYTTRDVEASSLENAKLEAINLIKNDELLKEAVINEKDDSPMIFVEEMRILEEEERLKNKGFTWYSE